jgi:hypothetical protein
MSGNEPLAGTWLRQFAERAFDRETVDRVILPAIADVQHEQHERAAARGGSIRRSLMALRGYWGLLKTFAICTIADVAHNRDRVASSLGLRTAAILVVVLAGFLLPNISWMLSFGSAYGAGAALTAGAFLLPTNVLVALPAAFFVALALFPTGKVPAGRLLPAAAVGSVISAVIVAALLFTIGPQTNQAYRMVMYTALQRDSIDGPPRALSKGLTEMTLPELNTYIRQGPDNGETQRARAHRQERFAFVGTALVLGLMGLALAGLWRSRLPRFCVAFVVLATYVAVFGYQNDHPPAYGAWTANVIFLIAGVSWLRSRRDWSGATSW